MLLVTGIFVLLGTHFEVDAQSCLCLTADGVNVRDAPCGGILGSGNSGDCFEDQGGSQQCDLGGTTYNFLEVLYAGQSGWIADDFLESGDCSTPPPGVCENVQIVTRAEWGARPPTSTTPLSIPVPNVYVHHTDGSECSTQAACSSAVKAIQDYHMDSNGWSDIGYNFLVGGDGRVYEGRGFTTQGAHTCCGGCNSQGIGISLMGDFDASDAPQIMLTTLEAFIECLIIESVVNDPPAMSGHRDECSTTCPGDALYAEIQSWAWYQGSRGCC